METHAQAAGIPLEMADRDTIVATVTVADTRTTIGQLTADARPRYRGRVRPASPGRHRGELDPRPPPGARPAHRVLRPLDHRPR